MLTHDATWDQAAALYFQNGGRDAGNGSLMRATFASHGQAATMDAARRIAALTHGDPAAWEGTAVYLEVIRLALEGHDPITALPTVIALVHPDHRARYATVLDPTWRPDQATEFNGAIWPCLGSAVWALRTTTSFEHALRAAIGLGGDTDTVAAITGGLAGAVHGPHTVPHPLDHTPPRPHPRLP